MLRATALPQPRPKAKGQSALQSPEDSPKGAHLASGALQSNHPPAPSCELAAATAPGPPRPQPGSWGRRLGPGSPRLRGAGSVHGPRCRITRAPPGQRK